MTASRSATPRYVVGERVRVISQDAEGHCRTPWYLRGREGIISAVQGAFHDPERLAYHKPGLSRGVLYKVRFSQKDLWDRYGGPLGDQLEADIYERWLECSEKGK